MLKNKCVVLGVTGSIAAYKIANLASALKKMHCDVQVIMTQNATQFITPVTFETLTGNKCLVDTFDRNFTFEVEHISVAKKADLVLVAPASANVIGKLAHGIADDMLTTTILACKCPKYISPAMNTGMYENPVVQDNLKTLAHYDWQIIDPACGYLACGDTGAGKMPEPEVLLSYILRELAYEKDLTGKKVLVTAGPTQEAIDPVRFIGNRSSGKMGYAIACDAARRGADVILVSGPTALAAPRNVTVIPVESTQEMLDACLTVYDSVDAVIKAAAVADYRPHEKAAQKIKKNEESLTIDLDKNPDILKLLGEKKTHQFLVGFAAETQNLIANAAAKVQKKHLDMIVANDVTAPGAGFSTDTNIVKLLFPDGSIKEPGLMSKEDVGNLILDIVRDQTARKK